MQDELADVSPEYEQINMEFYLTSIYDHSLHEAFSKVLQKLVDSLPAYEELINVFCAVSERRHLGVLNFDSSEPCQNSQSSKAFLCDIKSRLYIATDNSPVDPPDFGLCADFLQMLNSFGPLYR